MSCKQIPDKFETLGHSIDAFIGNKISKETLFQDFLNLKTPIDECLSELKNIKRIFLQKLLLEEILENFPHVRPDSGLYSYESDEPEVLLTKMENVLRLIEGRFDQSDLKSTIESIKYGIDNGSFKWVSKKKNPWKGDMSAIYMTRSDYDLEIRYKLQEYSIIFKNKLERVNDLISEFNAKLISDSGL